MSENIFKVWGERRRVLLTDKIEIDLLYLKKDSFCSTHSHINKTNKFVVVKGRVKIETNFGHKILYKKESFTVYPSVRHRFVALDDSIMIELAYVTEGKIDPNDIGRISQGGRIINGQEKTEDQLREEGLLDL